MARISPSDNLFATVYQRGREVFRYSGSGIDSAAMILEKMRGYGAATAAGIATLNIRNASQGWSSTSSVYLT